MRAAAHVLVVSPDGAVLETAQRCLLGLGHTVLLSRTVGAAQRTLARTDVDLLCLDSLLPSNEAESLLRWLQSDASRPTPPLIRLAPPSAFVAPPALDAERQALVKKPLDFGELGREAARLLAPTTERRRARGVVRAGPARLDIETRRLEFANGAALTVTPTECRLLRYLMERAGEFVSADELLEGVWSYPPGTGGPEVVRAHVSNLRRKLRGIGQDPQLLQTEPFRGYCFGPDAA